MIPTNSGLCVYRNSRNLPEFIAYQKLTTHYIVVIYCRREASLDFWNFSELLDAIPIDSIKIQLSFPLYPSLDVTLIAWKHKIYSTLLKYSTAERPFFPAR